MKRLIVAALAMAASFQALAVWNIQAPEDNMCFRDLTMKEAPDGNYYYQLHTPVELTIPAGGFDANTLSSEVVTAGHCSDFTKSTIGGLVWRFVDGQEQYHDGRYYGSKLVVGIGSCNASCTVYPTGVLLKVYNTRNSNIEYENVPTGTNVRVMLMSYSPRS